MNSRPGHLVRKGSLGPTGAGENPDFNEVELRWVREDLTRLAALLTGEIHVSPPCPASCSWKRRRNGMVCSRQRQALPTNYLTMFLGGQYYGAYQDDYDPSVPWANPDHGYQDDPAGYEQGH